MRVFKWILFLLMAAGVLTAVGLFTLQQRLGGHGKPFPDMATTPLLPDSALELVATLKQPPGNLAVSSTGRVFFTSHAEARPDTKVWELVNGTPVAYPNDEWQQPRAKGAPFFDQIFSLRIDRLNRLWTLDHGFHGVKSPRLLAFDLASNQLVHRYEMPAEVAGVGSYMQDMQVDRSGRYLYIADLGVLSSHPGLIVYDSVAKTARRLLDRHPALMAQPFEINAQGRKFYPLDGLYWMHPAFDPIALDRRGEWLYVGPMSGDTLSRVRVADLNNTALSVEQLAAKVEPYAKKSQSDGITMDDADNIYLSSIEDGAINIIGTDRQQKTLLKHPKLRWPDGFSFGPDDYVYVTDSDLPDVLMQSQEHIRASGPFYIFRFKALATAVAGQ